MQKKKKKDLPVNFKRISYLSIVFGETDCKATGHSLTRPGVMHKGVRWQAADTERSGYPKH